VNKTVEAVGFDFIRKPEPEYSVRTERPQGILFDQAVIQLKTFNSEAIVRSPEKRENLETLSMVMVDYDFNSETEIFDFDDVFYAGAIKNNGWQIRFPLSAVGKQLMAVFVDVYGNGAREVITAEQFGTVKRSGARPAARKAAAGRKRR
jgi:hypothetical protein